MYLVIFSAILCTVLFYILFKTSKEAERTEKKIKKKKSQPSHDEKKKKPAKATRKKSAHSWLMGTLKGHLGHISDMDFAGNEKYLASSADDQLDKEAEDLPANITEANVEESSPEPASISGGLTSDADSADDLKLMQFTGESMVDGHFQRNCSRCCTSYTLTSQGYIDPQFCRHHWGKRVYDDTSDGDYTCCSLFYETYVKGGCTTAKYHVWNHCSEVKDRSVFIWDMRELIGKNRRSYRINIDFDYATHIKWSPDYKAFLIHKFQSNCIEVYKVEKKKDGWLTANKATTFEKMHQTDVVGMGIANNGKFIMTCSNKTDMIIWSLKGEKLAAIDTFLMNTTCAKVSPCGRFVVASGFTPEAKVWEVIFNKTGDFKEVKSIPELTLGGHSSGVYDVAFDSNCTRMATVSKDGKWKLFDINVNYKQGQDAKLLLTADYVLSGNYALIALSPNGNVVVIASGSDLRFYSTLDGKLDCTIEDVSEEDSITSILFDPSGKYLLASVENQIKIFHNVTGYRCSIVAAKMELTKSHQTSANRERLNKIVADSEAFLTELEKTSNSNNNNHQHQR